MLRVEILGSAGALPAPRPASPCRICVEAPGVTFAYDGLVLDV